MYVSKNEELDHSTLITDEWSQLMEWRLWVQGDQQLPASSGAETLSEIKSGRENNPKVTVLEFKGRQRALAMGSFWFLAESNSSLAFPVQKPQNINSLEISEDLRWNKYAWKSIDIWQTEWWRVQHMLCVCLCLLKQFVYFTVDWPFKANWKNPVFSANLSLFQVIFFPNSAEHSVNNSQIS